MDKPLRILHLIDSLSLGGAERVAVNLFNSLNEQGVKTWICSTRKEGPLINFIRQKDRYFFLAKKSAFDIFAFFKLVQFIRKNQIDIVHAHSTSLAWAVTAKFFTKVRLVWHDHYGNSEFLANRSKFLLYLLSKNTDYVICVNQKLKEWCINILNIPNSKITYLPNFPDLNIPKVVKIASLANEIPILICVANLRFPKDHSNLIKALQIIHKEGHDFKTWLIGKDFNDLYSKDIKASINSFGLDEKVELLGARMDIAELLQKADIGVLSSSSEGLPVALLEYGLVGLPVVCTNVGQCAEVIRENGFLVPPENAELFANALLSLLMDRKMRNEMGLKFQKGVIEEYGAKSVTSRFIEIYQLIENNQ